MRIATAVAVALAVSCQTPAGGYAQIERSATFEGPGTITIVGDSDRDLDALEKKLTERGFTVARAVLAVLVSLKSRYVLHVEGGCWRGLLQRGDLHVEVFDTASNERVFLARLADNDYCPRLFFEDVADALLRAWRPTPGPVPG